MRSAPLIFGFLTILCINGLTSAENLQWIRDRPVETLVGPEDAIYCRVEDPTGFAVYDGFGRCNITITRAASEHSGTWKTIVGLPERILTTESQFIVNVVDAESKPVVTTSVSKNAATFAVSLACSVQSQYEAQTCKFRDPTGRVLLASPGVVEERYVVDQTQVSYKSNLDSHSCGIQITNPTVEDLGLWRCAIDTEGDTYYGFITVVCPWAMQDPEVAASVVTEPILSADKEIVSSIEGDSVTLSCSIQSAIEYCYFRSRNGTIYSVGEGTSNDVMEYVGAGFDAGECGIRFRSLSAGDSGDWSCHVGVGDSSPEQKATINMEVQEPIVVNQYLDDNMLVVEGQVHGQRNIEHCRFVRIDGFGFSDSNVPDGYTSNIATDTGSCVIHVAEPSVLDLHPWTVVARVQGHDEEVSGVTPHTLHDLIPGADGDGRRMPLKCLLLTIFLSVTAVFLVGWFVVRKMKPNWLSRRATSIRNSFRSSIKKEPLPDLPQYNASNKETTVTVSAAA